MQTKIIELPERTYVGRQVTTNYDNELSTATARIAPAWNEFMGEQMLFDISGRSNEACVHGLYSDYTMGHLGQYSLTIGTFVNDDSAVDSKFTLRKVPAQKYMVFTTDQGPMPDVVIDTWRHIWQFFSNNKEYERNFEADFEEYDMTKDRQNSTMDIYIGIK
ncbi:MAG: GyrI-like domain-containing protein [Alphaproteobacteria bacterium]